MDALNTDPITMNDLIQFGVLIIAALGFALALYKVHVNSQIKIHQNSLGIIALQKEISEIKQKSEMDDKELKKEFLEMFIGYRKEDKDEHLIITKKLDNVHTLLTTVSASFQAHEKYEDKKTKK